MSIETFTFANFLAKSKDNHVILFNKLFAEDISTLPNHKLTSKQTRRLFLIDTPLKEIVYKQVFLDYFKQKMNSSMLDK